MSLLNRIIGYGWTYDRNVDLPTSGSPRMRMVTSGDGSGSSIMKGKCLEGRESLIFKAVPLLFLISGCKCLEEQMGGDKRPGLAQAWH